MASRESRFGVALYGNYDRQIADDFAGLDSPKLKFNFTMSIEFGRILALNLPQQSRGNDDPYRIEFGIKQITRPAPNIIYEDVNFYNFMTKVATRVDYGVVTVTLYDDVNNYAHEIFKAYMEYVSPLTNMNRDQAPLLDRYGQSQAAGLGPLDDQDRHGPIKSLRVNHILDYKGKKVMYDFLNPKIQNVILDELDMTQSDVNTITFTFTYDSYHVTQESGGPEGIDEIYINQTGAISTNARRNIAFADIILDDIPVSLDELPNVPSLLERIRDQINIDGIPSQVLIEQLQRMGVDTGGLAGSAVRSVIRRIMRDA
jgi:hypothetical protein